LHCNSKFVTTYIFDAEEKRVSINKSTKIVNKYITTIKTSWIDIIKRVYSSKVIINCREHKKLNWGNWWIMHLHNIGLPPTTNIYSKVLVSGNSLIKTQLK